MENITIYMEKINHNSFRNNFVVEIFIRIARILEIKKSNFT
jgi:hypothetical protein